MALVPARGGSKRLPNKNIRPLRGSPLILYSLELARRSNIFSEIVVSTDSLEISKVVQRGGYVVRNLRPSALATDSSPDIFWVQHALRELLNQSIDEVDYVFILRPTNPFRTIATLNRALEVFANHSWADSLRGMSRSDRHPGKMWKIQDNGQAIPYVSQIESTIPTHDQPTQNLETIWIQNASLEIIKTSTIQDYNSISGKSIFGFEMPGHEGFDINSQLDWQLAELLIQNSPEILIEI